MDVGFLVKTQENRVDVQLDHTGGDRPSLVASAQILDCSVALIGRLYYRQDWLDKLAAHLPAALLRECRDNGAALAGAVYRNFGGVGLAQLEGDFALVIWDIPANCLIGCRDPLGGYPLFWIRSHDKIALSNRLKPLLDLLPQRSLSLNYLAEFLMIPGPVGERNSESCAYEGVHRVVAGTIVKIEIATGRIDQHRYWNWQDQIAEPPALDEVSDRYRDLLRQSIQERINGQTSAHLSGGMDSTAISLIADDLIQSGVGETPLHTLSLVYRKLPGLSRERTYLESVLQASRLQEPTIAIHRIPADDLLDFDGFADPPPHDEPYVVLWRLGMDRALVNAAARCGSSTMLTGLGADEMLDVQPFYLTDLLRQGRFSTAWQEAAKWAASDNCSPWRILYPFGIANVLPAWTQRIHQVLPAPISRLNRQTDWSVPPWVLPEFAHQNRLHHASQLANRTDRTCPQTVSFAIASIESRIGDVVRWSVAAPQGMAIAHPFLDLRILRFCLGVLRYSRPEPGRMKPLLADAMQGILPDNIRTRRRKGQFNEVYYLGLARNLKSLEAMVQQSPIDDLGIFNKDSLISYLREAALGSAHVRQLHRLNLTLSLIRWLNMQK